MKRQKGSVKGTKGNVEGSNKSAGYKAIQIRNERGRKEKQVAVKDAMHTKQRGGKEPRGGRKKS